MKIAIDAMGGDNAPELIVKGVLQAAKELPEAHLILVGDATRIKEVFTFVTPPIPGNVEIVHASEVIATDEEPVKAVRRKKDSSLVVAVEMVKQQKADAVISAGNTGAFMTAGLLYIGRIKGIERPALAPIFPTVDGKGTLVLDVGANMDAKPEHLVQYAIMGSIYAENIRQISRPRVGLLNVGTEDNKGNELTKMTFSRLKEAPLHFVGNVEARELTAGVCDVLVCDGFSGNILLKSTEGMASSLFVLLKREFTRNMISKFATALLKPGLMRLKRKMDYAEYGGAPLLGLNGVCIKAHGSSDDKAVKNAVIQAGLFVKGQLIQKISKEVSDQRGS